MQSDLRWLVGVRNAATAQGHWESTAKYIATVFRQSGFEVTEESFQAPNGITGRNVLATLRGQITPDSIYILGAHYDTVPDSPGADDNGSGIAALLAAARALGKHRFASTVRLIAFDREEAGLQGSYAYAAKARQEGEQIKGAIIFESIGYASNRDSSQSIPAGFASLYPDAVGKLRAQNFKGDFLTVVPDAASKDLAARFYSAAQRYIPELSVITVPALASGLLTPDLRRSDHAAFWDFGYKALMLTDTANFRNPNYHTSNDTLGTINLDFTSQVAKAAVATLVELAQVMHAGSAVSGKFKLDTRGRGKAN